MAANCYALYRILMCLTTLYGLLVVFVACHVSSGNTIKTRDTSSSLFSMIVARCFSQVHRIQRLSIIELSLAYWENGILPIPPFGSISTVLILARRRKSSRVQIQEGREKM